MIWVHDLNPVALDLGFAEIRWYGVFYLAAFLITFFWLKFLVRRKLINFSARQIEDLIFGIILGVIIGGRLGHFILYDFENLFSLEIFKIWRGGMSFHGGLVGVFLAVFYLARKWGRSFLEIADIIVIPAAIGLFFGRLGNFVNAELVGRMTNKEWGVIFPNFDESPRYPSQLFEAAKNIVIFITLLLTFRAKPRRGVLTFLFLILYGIGRTTVEIFWREPIAGFIVGLPKGAFYSLPVLLVGIIGLILVSIKKK